MEEEFNLSMKLKCCNTSEEVELVVKEFIKEIDEQAGTRMSKIIKKLAGENLI